MRAALGAALLSSLGACEQIVGIEERKVTTDGGVEREAGGDVENPTQQQCDEYCGLLEEGCTPETSGLYAYRKDTDYCDKLCLKLPLATDPSATKSGHSFECRLAQAKDAKTLKNDPGEGAANCKRAGAGGDGTCGSNCEAYCQLFTDICSETDFKPRENCLEECSKLRDDDSVDADDSFANNIDTVQCRLTHLGAASSASPQDHCQHASIYVDGYTPCISPTPRCADYCALTMNVCNDEGEDDHRQYETLQDCLNTCNMGLTNSLPLMEGETQDKNRDTVACRRYHAYNALLIDKVHCNHAGPGGDGHCSFICPAYCSLVKAACKAGYDAEYRNDAECEKECADAFFGGNTDIKKQVDLGYNVGTGKAGGNTIQCRLYYASKAFGSPTQCTSALGGDKCAP